MGDALDEPVLLIKCAWGGKSLAVDFRPPSAGKPPYSLGEKADAAIAQDPAIVGKYYRETLALTKAALANIKDLVPGSDGRYVLAGFGWHQGWNDRINDKFNAEYESNMAHFIRDIRKDLGVPALPFVIAETGMSGPEEKHPRALVADEGAGRRGGAPGVQGQRGVRRHEGVLASEGAVAQRAGLSLELERRDLLPHRRSDGPGNETARYGRRRPSSPGRGDGRLPAGPARKVPETYNAGFSMYVAAWPLLQEYPGNRFQTGLFGTWMFAQYDGPKPRKACIPTSRAGWAGGATPGSPPKRRSSSWAGWP